jgi:hypothetical protein
MNSRHLAVIPAILALVSCGGGTSPETEKKAEPAKTETAAPAAPVAAKAAFFDAYKPAFQWARDMQPLKIESGELSSFKNADGKAAVWKITFGSPSRKEARTWTYAIAADAANDIPTKGLSVGSALPWPGPSRDVMPFTSSDVATDSDAAFKAAAESELGAKFLKEHPDKNWSMTLGNAARFSGPVWRVMWGDNKMGYLAFVDARSGKVLKK